MTDVSSVTPPYQRPTHEEIEALLGAYALDALEPDEAAMVAAHLRECIRCSVEVAQGHEVAGLLANSGGDAPGELWNRIADRLGTPSVAGWDRLAARLDPPPMLAGADEHAAAGAASGRVETPESRASVIPLDAARRRSRMVTRAASLVAVAAAVLAIALGVQVNHLDNRVSAMSAAVSHPALSTAAEAALEDPSTQRVTLTPPATGTQPAASVTVVISKSGTGYLIPQGLTSLPSYETYQFWGSIGGTLISLGVLGPNPHVTAFSFDSAVPVRAFAITAEPAGGVVRPTHQPIVQGAVLA